MSTENIMRDSSCAFDCIAVTNVNVWIIKDLGHLKALAQVVLNDQFLIRGLRVMDGCNGLFVAYPTDPFYKGEDMRSICLPITKQLKMHIENCILKKYQEVSNSQEIHS